MNKASRKSGFIFFIRAFWKSVNCFLSQLFIDCYGIFSRVTVNRFVMLISIHNLSFIIHHSFYAGPDTYYDSGFLPAFNKALSLFIQ